MAMGTESIVVHMGMFECKSSPGYESGQHYYIARHADKRDPRACVE